MDYKYFGVEFFLKAHDYVNVICGRNSHWDEIGKSQTFQTEVLSCQQNRIVQATLAHRRDLKEKVLLIFKIFYMLEKIIYFQFIRFQK